MLVDAERRLHAAEARRRRTSIIDSNFRAGGAEDSRDQRIPIAYRAAFPSFQVGGWANLGNREYGQSVPVQDEQSVASANLQWMKRRTCAPLRVGLSRTSRSITSSRRGGTFQTGARHVPVQRQLDAAAERADAGGHAVQQLG